MIEREYFDEEERIVAVVGGRARRLVEAVRRIERGRAGRTLPNFEEAPNGQTRTNRQEVGTAGGRAEVLERLIPGLGVYKPGEEEAEASSLSNTHSTPPEPITRENHQT